MARVISREQFMDLCPADLKKRIEDFIVYYSEKKKTASSSDSTKKFENFSGRDGSKHYQKKKPSNINFRKPFEKDMSSYEKFFVDYRGILSKVSENNQDAIWKELLELHLDQYVSNPEVKLSDTSVFYDLTKNHQANIAFILYQYTKSSSMYLKEYVELVGKMKKSKELSPFSVEYTQLVYNDLSKPKEDDKEYNILTHKIFAELTSIGLITKKKFISSGIVAISYQIEKNLEECESNEEPLEILMNNMRRMGNLIYKDKEVANVIEKMMGWKTTKTFNGKLHFNLMDTLAEIAKWS
jgi:hypothetical protein